ncbi:type II toxin-antitoxin system VapC family toxin [Desulfobacter sp.]|uniref:type II toxin-antitoxin system VapC family toxin n=1 Tax=Desulfobacter sp. TaxID=2294 RepID=UPI003D10D2B7
MVTIDTHVIIWDALKPELLSTKARAELKRASRTDGIVVCDISLWEIAMLMKKKRLELDIPYIEFIRLVMAANNFIFQKITPELADLSTILPADINSDPADRLISATSIITNTPLITADKNLRKSEKIKTIW